MHYARSSRGFGIKGITHIVFHQAHPNQLWGFDPVERWMTWSSAPLTHAFSGTRPSWVACMRSVSLVARLTWLTKAEAGTEKA
jgi:hypothetical protein